VIKVRNITESDEAAWRGLWAAYNTFYEASVPDAVTASAWRRLIDPASALLGRIAVRDGRIAGFSHSVLHEGTWTADPICYLEDLFVAPEARGAGAGRALIQDLVDLGKARGWSRLYWHTRAGNAAARKLYDSFVEADDFVRYRMFLR
jgi:GNAT superfamily N-acetyltransferase